MKRFFIFLFMLTIGFVACNSSKNNEETTDNTETPAMDDTDANETTTTSGEGYETVVLKADIPSPRKEMTATVGENTIVVNYGSPSVKGRTIFGDLEPYDKVWRTGANEATTFEISSDIKVQGESLSAGKYGLFTIPKEDGNWTLIFNSVADQWGAYNYDESKDVLRVNVTTKTLEEASETLEFLMDGGNLIFQWNKTALPIQIEL